MQTEELITRRGEFLEELYGEDTQEFSLYTDSQIWLFEGSRDAIDNYDYFPLTISFVRYEPETNLYRGSDYVPEYHPPIPIVTYELRRADLESRHYGVPVLDLVKGLVNDGAITVPLDRHYRLISFLLERQDLITYDSFGTYGYKEKSRGIIAYAGLNFVIKPNDLQSEPNSLHVTRDGSIVAKYDIVKLGNLLQENRKASSYISYTDSKEYELRYFLRPKYGNKNLWKGMVYRNHPELYRNYPVYYNMPLIWEIREHPQLLEPGFSFDNFSLL